MLAGFKHLGFVSFGKTEINVFFFFLVSMYSFISRTCFSFVASLQETNSAHFPYSRRLCILPRFIITCLWLHPMNTDSISQKEWLRQTGWEEREADCSGTISGTTSGGTSLTRTPEWPRVWNTGLVFHGLWSTLGKEKKYSTYWLTFYLYHSSCWIILKSLRWPQHSSSLFTWLQFKIWIAVYAGRLNTQSAVFELKLYCSLMEMPVSSVSSLL